MERNHHCPPFMIETTVPEIHKKGWGYELWLVNNERYCGKVLVFFKDKKCSFHYHKKKHEHFFISKGSFLIKASWEDNLDAAEVRRVFAGAVLEIPPLYRHQMIALEDSEITEISTQHFEDDSYRIVKGD